MKPAAIVYTSANGHTARYAAILSEKIGLPAITLEESFDALAKGTAIIYMGWLMAGSVKGYAKAVRRFDICAVLGVGLCTTGALIDQVRKTARIPNTCPLFTLQGGMDRDKLEGIHAKMIDTLILFMTAKKNKNANDEEMLRLLTTPGDYVAQENLADVLDWFAGI